MSTFGRQPHHSERQPHAGWDDRTLVEDCLRGNEAAWEALVDKYATLVYAVARASGLPPDEAADVFQTVWADAYEELPALGGQGPLRTWLIDLGRNRCGHWRYGHGEAAARGDHDPGPPLDVAAIAELERDQLVREAIQSLPPRCRDLVRVLFHSDPPRPYREVAEELGIAIRSAGSARGRCLQSLERTLVQSGVV